MKHHLILLMALICMPLTAKAYDFCVDKIYHYIISEEEKTCAVTYAMKGVDNASTYKGDIVIPSMVEYKGTTYTITRIGDSAFAHCSGLTTISLPNTITRIGISAFYRCSKLTYGTKAAEGGHDAIYGPAGERRNTLKPGLNLVRRNGHTMKVIIK